MNKKYIAGISLSLALALSSCETLQQVAKDVQTNLENGTTTTGLSTAEVVGGLKEALTVGITNSVNITSITDGFLKNDLIKIPFPADAEKVRQKAIEWGLSGQVDKIVTTLNRAAEDASKEALPIFKDAIVNMSIQDGFSILKGGNGAATNFLRNNTKSQLVAAFSPKVQNSIEKVKLTEYWNPVITKYNTAMNITGGNKINPDLNAYITERAIDGLFKLVEDEENKIRSNPQARVTELLQKVFKNQ